MRAIDLSVKKYCPVHAMLEKAFPIDLNYSIYEDEGNGKQKLVKQGTYQTLILTRNVALELSAILQWIHRGDTRTREDEIFPCLTVI